MQILYYTNIVLNFILHINYIIPTFYSFSSFRGFLENVVIQTIHELNDKNTYHSLIDAVKQEKLRKQKLQDTIRKWVTLLTKNFLISITWWTLVFMSLGPYYKPVLTQSLDSHHILFLSTETRQTHHETYFFSLRGLKLEMSFM